MNQYKGGGGSDESFWLTSFNNDGYTVNRVKSEPVVIDKIFINIIGTIQPDVLTDILSKQKNNGFIDRFLFSRSEKYAHGLNDVEIPDSVFTLWNDYCYNLNKSYQYDDEQYYLSEFTPKAKEYHIEIANSYAKMQNDESNTMTMRSYISKLRVYIPRFALFFSFIDHTDPHVAQPSLNIEVHHLERAKKVCDYFLATAEEVFVENVEKSEAKTVDPKKGTNQERIAAMLDKNIAQKVIAETIGVSKAYVSRIKKQLENG
jgi:DNA-binding XRE family transcriptional regulator